MVVERRAELTSFVGRAAELARMNTLFASGHRWITLFGLAGCGKTRLANELARRVSRKRGSATTCDLTEARSLEDACSAIAVVMRVPLADREADGGVVASLASALAARGRGLLILDNCEHLLDELAPAAIEWLARATDLRILMTSRETAGVLPELAMRVEPLRVPDESEATPREIAATDAVALFVQRAAKVTPDFKIDAKNCAAVAAIARRLDGLPLALELAAARTDVLGVQGLLDRLLDPRHLLRSARRDPSRRHATLEAAIEWSVKLLAPFERSALAQSSVFAGGFSLSAAEGVIDLSSFARAPPVLDVIRALLSKSLLKSASEERSSREPRFTHYETVRGYAASSAPEGLLADAASRHAAYYLRVGSQWKEAARSRPEALRMLSIELPNMLAVVRRALEAKRPSEASLRQAAVALLTLEPFAVRRGPFPWSLRLIRGVLDAAPKLDRGTRVRLLALEARLEAIVGTPGVGAVTAERAHALAEEGDDPALKAEAALALAFVAWVRGRIREAERHYASASVAAKKAGNPGQRANAECAGAVLRAWSGRVQGGLKRIHGALELARAADDRVSEGGVLYFASFVHLQLDRCDEAQAYCEGALAIFREHEESRSEAVALTCLGQIHRDGGRLDDANRCFEESRDKSRLIGDRAQEAAALTGLAGTALLGGSPAVARERAEEALPILRAMNNDRGEAQALGYSAVACAWLGLRGESRTALELAARKAEGAGDVVPREIALLDAARAVSMEGADRAVIEAKARALMKRPNGPARRRTPHPADLRMALRCLELSIERASPKATTARSRPTPGRGALTVDVTGRWFERDGGERVTLERSAVLIRLVEILALAHLKDPKRMITTDELFAKIWPGERASAAAAVNRVYVAVARLRKLGLGDSLLGTRLGYRLDPAVRVDPNEASSSPRTF